MNKKDGFKKWLNFFRTLEKTRKIKENRVAEEKKYGLKAARRAPQFSKRNFSSKQLLHRDIAESQSKHDK